MGIPTAIGYAIQERLHGKNRIMHNALRGNASKDGRLISSRSRPWSKLMPIVNRLTHPCWIHTVNPASGEEPPKFRKGGRKIRWPNRHLK
jgi:hypothetical protein